MNMYSFLYTNDLDSVTIDNRARCVPNAGLSTEGNKSVMEKKADKKLVSFRLPEDLLQHLRDKADYSGISVTELVCRLLRQGLLEEPDDRIKTLESEIHELRQQLKQPTNAPNVTHTVLYPMPPQPATLPYENHAELEQRMNKMESMLEKVVSRIMQEQGNHSESDH